MKKQAKNHRGLLLQDRQLEAREFELVRGGTVVVSDPGPKDKGPK